MPIWLVATVVAVAILAAVVLGRWAHWRVSNRWDDVRRARASIPGRPSSHRFEDTLPKAAAEAVANQPAHVTEEEHTGHAAVDMPPQLEGFAIEWGSVHIDVSAQDRPAPAPRFSPSPASQDPAARPTASMSDIRFSAYYPKEVTPSTWHPLHAYVFQAEALSTIQADARERLGAASSGYREHTEAAKQKLAEGAVITATPQLDGFQFNPPYIAIGLYEEWHRLDFKVRASSEYLDRSSNGLLTFTCEGVIIADIPLSIFVGERVEVPDAAPVTYNAYDAVFCSYSHEDEAVVRRVELACQALGLQYLRDVTTLRSGQKWDEELLKMIDRSDLFQLFWSESAAMSQYVAAEWHHALEIDRDSTRFIRPVYWKRPMPPPPPELSSIHFSFTPQLAEGA